MALLTKKVGSAMWNAKEQNVMTPMYYIVFNMIFGFQQNPVEFSVWLTFDWGYIPDF